MSEEPKTCRRCGKLPVIHENDWAEPPMWSAMCECPFEFATREEAVANWNIRANPLPDVSGLVEALELPECAAGCEGLCEQKYVAEPDVHACCVVRRLHRALAAFQSHKEESR